MKRFTTIVLALIMLFTLAVSVAADVNDSPTPKEYYNITVDNEGSGSGSSDTNKVEKNSDGTVTLIASDDEGFFTRWIITGDYEILNGGTLEDPVITIRPKSDIEAVANFSKDPNFLTMEAKAVTPGNGTASVDIEKVEKGTEVEVTFTAVEGDDTFIEWEFQCDYKLVSGDLKSKTVVLIPYTDVLGIAYFEQGANPDNPDDKPDSPKTGDVTPYVIVLMVVALGAAVVAAKKLKKD